MNRESIDSLARRLAASLPQSLKTMRDDVEENFRAVLKSGLQRMDLVTREEFEVQELVLRRTREKLESLEARLSAYEDAAAANAPAAAGKKTRKKSGKKSKTKTKAAANRKTGRTGA